MAKKVVRRKPVKSKSSVKKAGKSGKSSSTRTSVRHQRKHKSIEHGSKRKNVKKHVDTKRNASVRQKRKQHVVTKRRTKGQHEEEREVIEEFL